MTNKTNSTLYVGVTNNIKRRAYEHKNGTHDGFTKKYNINKVVYVEQTSSVDSALNREKQLKRWSRKKKEELISFYNPAWTDLDC